VALGGQEASKDHPALSLTPLVSLNLKQKPKTTTTARIIIIMSKGNCGDDSLRSELRQVRW